MSVRREGDRRWRIDVVVRRAGERVRVREAATSRAAALARERELRAQVDDGWRPGVKAPTFAEWSKDFVNVYAVNNNKPSEVETKRSVLRVHLLPAFGEMRLDEIGLVHVERFKADELARGAKPKSINNDLTIVRKSLDVAREWGKLAGAPPKIKWLRFVKPERDFFAFEEAVRLLEGADPEWRAMILIGLRTGLRLGELLALTWDAVDLVAGRLRVRQAAARGIVGTPKNDRHREVPLSDEARAALRGLSSRLQGKLVFPGPGGAMLTRGECRHPLWRACRKAGLRRVGWHILRHTFASHLVMRGVPLRTIQELMGHSTIEMTMRYAHLSPDVRRDAVKLLDEPAPTTAATSCGRALTGTEGEG